MSYIAQSYERECLSSMYMTRNIGSKVVIQELRNSVEIQ